MVLDEVGVPFKLGRGERVFRVGGGEGVRMWCLGCVGEEGGG